MMMSTNSYEFHRSRKLNRSARAPGADKWQSVGGLREPQAGTLELNFGRLRKSYASMRKSFRLPATGGDGRFDFGDDSKSSLMGALGNGAARLWRGVKQVKATQLSSELNSTTDGSFKLLSPAAGGCHRLASEEPRKSDAQLEIERRLQRSKRRVLASARYKAPDSERACDGLDLDELEEMKRDNLRQTLLKTQEQQQRLAAAPLLTAPVDITSALHDKSEHIGACSCKDLGCSRDELPTDTCNATSCQSLEDGKDHQERHAHYCSCTCVSIESSSSSSSTNLRLTSEMESDKDKCSPLISTSSRLARSSSITGGDHSLQDNNLVACDKKHWPQGRACERLEESRASGGFVDELASTQRQQQQVAPVRFERASSVNELTSMQVVARDNSPPTKLGNVCGDFERQQQRAAINPLAGDRLSTIDGQQALGVALNCRVARAESQAQELENQQQQQRRIAQVSSGGCSLGGVTSSGARITTSGHLQSSLSELALSAVESESCMKQQVSATSGGRPLCAIELRADSGRQKEIAWPEGTSGCGRNNADELNEIRRVGRQDPELSSSALDHSKAFDGDEREQDEERYMKSVGARRDSPENVGNLENDEEKQTKKTLARNKRDTRSKKQEMFEDPADWRPTARQQLGIAYNQEQQQQRLHMLHRQQVQSAAQVYSSHEADDEHLYAIICGAHSPQSQGDNQYYLAPEWNQSEFADHHHNDLNYNQLIYGQLHREQQLAKFHHLPPLNRMQRQEPEKKHQKPSSEKPLNKQKKSLFSRLKQFIASSDNDDHQSKSNKELCQSGAKLRANNEERINIEPASFKSAKWRQKSATLSSRSTQNLTLTSSMRLSSSRKSIDLAGASERNALKALVANSGFLTLGRRSKSQKLSSESTRRMDEIQQMFIRDGVAPTQSTLGRYNDGGSADSLPSADSGLSCGNLQNSGSSEENSNYGRLPARNNLYSRGPLQQEQLEHRHRVTGTVALPVVGKARAKVDCNPCAYDKEALVFKRDDIIDILERHESGTWLGRCNDRVGHFKFINVTEIDDWQLKDGDGGAPNDELEDTVMDGRKTGGGGFVTKLEINSCANNELQTGTPKRRIDDVRPKEREVKDELGVALDPISRRSKSMSTIDRSVNNYGKHNNQTRTTTLHHQSKQKESSESIMSSLEQLLFAIGLAGEQVIRTEERNVADNEHANGQYLKRSYLDVLNGGGITSLDSFSAIDDWHELEQIGIVDDEHQRRLLMAARIIRQASQAAKLDFAAEYYQVAGTEATDSHLHRVKTTGQRQVLLQSSTLSSGQQKQQPAESVSDGALVPVRVTTKTTTCQREFAHSRSAEGATVEQEPSNVNEPIYVNLINGLPRSAAGEHLSATWHSSRKESVADDVDAAAAVVGDRKIEASKSCPDARDQGDEDGSINQLDHYGYARCCNASGNNLRQHTSGHLMHCYVDDDDNDLAFEGDDFVRTDDERQPCGRLTRGCSSRMSRRKFDFVKKSYQITGRTGFAGKPSVAHGNELIDEEDDYQRRAGQWHCRQQSAFAMASSKQVADNTSLLVAERRRQATVRRQVLDHWPSQLSVRPNQERSPVTTRGNHNYSNNRDIIIDRQMNDDSNLRSQINSTSAYDLRLDLSHFFS